MLSPFGLQPDPGSHMGLRKKLLQDVSEKDRLPSQILKFVLKDMFKKLK